MFTVRVLLTSVDHQRHVVDLLVKEAWSLPDHFDGCRLFEVATSATEPGQVVLVEEWVNAEKFWAYRQSEFFTARAGQVFPLLDGPPDSSYYESTRVGP